MFAAHFHYLLRHVQDGCQAHSEVENVVCLLSLELQCISAAVKKGNILFNNTQDILVMDIIMVLSI